MARRAEVQTLSTFFLLVLLSDFDFELPQELIAQHPLATRSASRLLHCSEGGMRDRMFSELPELLRAGDLLVFNDTRVIKARLFGIKASGGKAEVLVERVSDMTDQGQRVLAQMRMSHIPQPGTTLYFENGVEARYIERAESFFVLEFNRPVLEVLEQQGCLPLPPYISHAADAEDDERYQTVFARQPGAVAAPTAGLHFDDTILARLRAVGIETATLTLHVGAGTFQPVRVENIAEHVMHVEHYEITESLVGQIQAARKRGGRVIAVGTTSLRALESATNEKGQLEAGNGETRIFITPGYRFRMVDVLLTNFHLPKSTLLMLVSAFAGMERIRIAYQHAVKQGYRFFSYGDAMLLEPAAATKRNSNEV